jgi:hypothetical protein
VPFTVGEGRFRSSMVPRGESNQTCHGWSGSGAVADAIEGQVREPPRLDGKAPGCGGPDPSRSGSRQDSPGRIPQDGC